MINQFQNNYLDFNIGLEGDDCGESVKDEFKNWFCESNNSVDESCDNCIDL